jgi:hypothetical protein
MLRKQLFNSIPGPFVFFSFYFEEMSDVAQLTESVRLCNCAWKLSSFFAQLNFYLSAQKTRKFYLTQLDLLDYFVLLELSVLI